MISTGSMVQLQSSTEFLDCTLMRSPRRRSRRRRMSSWFPSESEQQVTEQNGQQVAEELKAEGSEEKAEAAEELIQKAEDSEEKAEAAKEVN